MSVSATPPPSPPGGDAFLIGRRPPLRGVIPEGTVVAKLFTVVDIGCSDTGYCFGIIGNGRRSSHMPMQNCLLRERRFPLFSFVAIFPEQSFANPDYQLSGFLRT